MRIIAGTARGTILVCPKGRETRPTPDRLRGSVLASIGGEIEDARVLDLFSGTGAMGIESLSRGAAHAVLADGGADAIDAIRRNLERTGLRARATVLRADLLRAGALPAERAFSFVFIGPPYRLYESQEGRDSLARLLSSLLEPGTLAPGARIFLQCPRRRAAGAEAIARGFRIGRTRAQGSNAFIELTPPEPGSASDRAPCGS